MTLGSRSNAAVLKYEIFNGGLSSLRAYEIIMKVTGSEAALNNVSLMTAEARVWTFSENYALNQHQHEAGSVQAPDNSTLFKGSDLKLICLEKTECIYKLTGQMIPILSERSYLRVEAILSDAVISLGCNLEIKITSQEGFPTLVTSRKSEFPIKSFLLPSIR